MSDIRRGRKARNLSILLVFVCANPCIQASDITLTILGSFSGTNGADPWASLVQGNNGNFYGTTYAGGPTTNISDFGHPGFGTIFKVTPDGFLTTLAAFYGTNGSHPRASLIQASDGNFYGTTCYGGSATNVLSFGQIGYGTVFKMTPDGGLNTLVSFNGTNGACPTAGLAEGPDGNLYGTTRYGGTSFNDPRAANTGYGVPGDGTIFRINTNGVLTTLFSFTPDTQGGQPMAPLTLGSDGSFYGIISGGTYGWGEIFRISLDGTFAPIASLDSKNGPAQLSAIIESRDGGFYGVGQVSGAYHCGAIYKVSPNHSISTVVSFTNSGAFSWGSVVEGTDGNLYGTTCNSSDHQYGYVYQVLPKGDYAVIASFALTNGSGPQTGMIQGRDGSLYGTTFSGGAYADQFGLGYGTIFRLTVPSAAAPNLRMPIQSETGMAISWSALPCRSYQVQYKNSLEDAWNNLGNTVSATNSVASTTDPVSPSARFYRVFLLPE
jgi:uncharacterized repeat protein (TIGR03803 family)